MCEKLSLSKLLDIFGKDRRLCLCRGAQDYVCQAKFVGKLLFT